MIGRVALSGLASILFLSISAQVATPPRAEGPHSFPAPTPAAEECGIVVGYAGELFATFDAHAVFSDFWINGDLDAIQEQDQEELQEIVDDGRALLEDLDALGVPGPYAPGHEGITLLFDSNVDYIEFLGIDSSTVPVIDQWDDSMTLILEGETQLAESCPDEVEELGGYLFFSIESIEDALEQ